MTKTTLLPLLTSLCALTACDPVSEESALPPATPGPPVEQPLALQDLEALRPAALERGKPIVQEAFTVLSTQLGLALQTGGVTNALSLCSVRALPLTKLVGDTNHVTLRRVTHKPRNPANRANSAEQHLLDCFQEMLDSGTTNLAPVVLTPSTNQISFCAPIVINNPLCLNCHGVPDETLLPAASESLRRLYPADEATGFKMGDLRGMWRVDFDPVALAMVPTSDG